jgi:hypothetical protein
MRPMKATNRAEKSGGSKPRRKRGLRRGKRRSRECHSRRTAPPRQPLPTGFSERSFKKVLTQFDFWELRIGQLREKISDSVKCGYKHLDVLGDFGWTKCFHAQSYRRHKSWYLSLRKRILSGHKGAHPLVQTENFDGDALFTAFLYKEFRWVPPHRGGVEKYRSEILDDLVRLRRPDFVNPPPLSEKKRRVVARRGPPKRTNGCKAAQHSVGPICRFCGKLVGELKRPRGRFRGRM